MKTLNGTYYNDKTSDEMMALLESIRVRGLRVRFHWGDVETGQDWGDEYGVAGKLSRSMGPQKIPILLHNSQSTGGGGILDHCIVRITETQGGKVLYQHPEYHNESSQVA